MLKAIKQMLTGIDNETLDVGRVLWAKMSIVYCAISSYTAIKHGSFDPQSWAIGAGAVLTAGGGTLALKSKTEPGNAGPSA